VPMEALRTVHQCQGIEFLEVLSNKLESKIAGRRGYLSLIVNPIAEVSVS
jgi:hypothetical protein